MPSHDLIKKYAHLLVNFGVNVKKGSYLVINATTDATQVVRLLTKAALEKGAKDVIVFYTDPYVDKERTQVLDFNTLSTLPEWHKLAMEHYFSQGADSIILKSHYPALMEEISDEASGALATFSEKSRSYVRKGVFENNSHWCVACVPNVEWAAHIFPNMDKEKALETLWQHLLDFCLIDMEADPVLRWHEDRKLFWGYKEALDKMDIDFIHFKNSLGTDIKIGFNPSHCWTCGISSDNFNDDNYLPNIPTAEIATSPDKFRAEGKVVSTKALILGGKLIDKFYLVFKEGKVVEAHAEVGNELLQHCLNTDEGSRYLGEVALVSKDSPIAQKGIIYYSTLLDENASCHLALGKGFPQCIKDFSSKNSFQSFNLNDSCLHVDFMFGSDDLSAVAYTKAGEEITLLKDGLIII